MKIEQFHAIMESFVSIEGRLTKIETKMVAYAKEDERKNNKLYFLIVPLLSIASSVVYQLMAAGLAS